jgi:hypothetical protein
MHFYLLSVKRIKLLMSHGGATICAVGIDDKERAEFTIL